jgi:hypothetical protein
MPTTWYVPRGGGAVATDASEPDGVSVAARLGELCEAVSTGVELVVIASTGGVSGGKILVARVSTVNSS